MSQCRSLLGTARRTSLLFGSSPPCPGPANSVRHRSQVATKKRLAQKSIRRHDGPNRGGASEFPFGGRKKYESPPADYHLRPTEERDPRLLQPRKPLDRTSSASEIIEFFEGNVSKWIAHRRVKTRLIRFAVPETSVDAVLDAFRKDVVSGRVRYTSRPSSTPWRNMSAEEKAVIDQGGQTALGYSLPRFARASIDDKTDVYMDIIYTAVLYAWAGSALAKAHARIPPAVLEQMAKLALAASPVGTHSSDHSQVRTLRRRFIMHVGPTNSGKTYTALRALAAAPTGIYAGPLRLLAHEIWERLNLGRIVPLGVDEAELKAEELENPDDSGLDVGDSKMLIKKGLGKYRWRRVCNMVTGEEMKIVDPFAPLISSTVEMISRTNMYDVAVIDEIQMLADPQRGSAWTDAVRFVNAYEIHLCGEATAIPVVRDLVESLGDSLEIREYHRLTPLMVEAEPLKNKMKSVQPGDAVVSFSRDSIFQVKAKLEKIGLSVAAIYGKLPPEVRSEQAALFNSGHRDVLVGSDAIGLGLNLKIRRMIFAASAKYGGKGMPMEPLSVTQVKQIAGRAGRYGLAKRSADGNEPEASPCGLVNALEPDDLPFLRTTLDITPPPVSAGMIDMTVDNMSDMMNCIPLPSGNAVGGEPANSYLVTLLHALIYTGQCPPWVRYFGNDTDKSWSEECMNWLESNYSAIPASERKWGVLPDFTTVLLLLRAPIMMRDVRAKPFYDGVARRFMTDLLVPLPDLLVEALPTVPGGFQGLIRAAEVFLKIAPPKEDTDVPFALPTLSEVLKLAESLHSVLGMYVWCHFRRPTTFPDHHVAEELLPRTKAVIVGLLNVKQKRMDQVMETEEIEFAAGQKDKKAVINTARQAIFSKLQKQGVYRGKS